jgi:endonuclease/exonuclease/phosphatase (EEP) superfamily protein YafD
MAKIIWLISSLIAIWLGLWRRFGDRWGWLGMLNAWAEWGVITLGGLAVVATLQRKWGQTITLLALMGMSLGRHVGNGALKVPVLGNNKLKVKVFSANLYKRNLSVAAHVKLIRQYKPDILCLQEFAPLFEEQVLAALGDEYPYHVLRAEAGAYGFGVLSRYPIAETGYWDEPGVRAWGQRVRCSLPTGQAIELYNVHLIPPSADSTFALGLTRSFRIREEQVRIMQEEIKARGLPACIIGDCNFADTSDAYAIACEQLEDSWLQAQQKIGWTWPTCDFPFDSQAWSPRLLRIDYCFHNQQLTTLDMKVLTDRTGSDHCPLLVSFSL